MRVPDDIQSGTGLRASLIARLFLQGDALELALLPPQGIQVRTKSRKAMLRLPRIQDIELKRGLLWSRLSVHVASASPIVLNGLNKARAAAFRDQLLAARSELHSLRELVAQHKETVSTIGGWLDRGERGEHWVAQHAVEAALEMTRRLDSAQTTPAELLHDDDGLVQGLHAIQLFRDDPASFRIRANACFKEKELLRAGSFFDRAEKNPLTDAQRLAVITHEDNTRVIAGAGSGKTSVMVVKAAYLLKKRLCESDQLLLIAYNRSAAEELKTRAEQLVGMQVNATTFHALGLDIIGQVTRRRPSVTKTAENPNHLVAYLRECLIDLIEDDAKNAVVRTYFQSFFAPYKSETEFENLGDYYEYLNTIELRSIRDERLRSFEEVEIANFLFMNSVEYVYEQPYAVDLADAAHRQYHPDFYLPEYDIYIEHFGIKRDGSTAPFVDQEKYLQEMTWKRSVHAQYGTTLIETYSYMKSEGTLLSELQRRLSDHGVDMIPVSGTVLLEELNKSKQIDPFSKLVAVFLNHFKGNGFSLDDVRERARARRCDGPRLDAFLNLFDPIHQRYQEMLQAAGEIDFEDMISQAAMLVKEGQYQSPFTCILVDEFQDISTGRAKLIKALADQAPSHRLFCVGDDWQAIYRFAGSDIALMRDFSTHFGFSETVTLDRTFRFNDRISTAASGFIQKNPSQLRKRITCGSKAAKPRVVVHRPEKKTDDVFLEALREIAQEAGPGTHTVLVLGRYNFVFDGLAWSDGERDFPNLRLRKSTIHKAKGGEADYVIVVQLSSGRWGFPSEIADDPLLDAVLSEPESFPHAEERRLFYVALTRARHAVHLLADYARPSVFIADLAAYPGSVDYRGAAAVQPVSCPDCVTGNLVRRTGQYGQFYSCGHYPRCTYKADTCKRCDQGAFVRDQKRGIYACSNLECGHVERICPRCGTGRLTERTGPYGVFLGCTNYASGACSYTERVPTPGAQRDTRRASSPFAEAPAEIDW